MSHGRPTARTVAVSSMRIERLIAPQRLPAAWHSTREALRAMGLSILIELTATVLATGAWLAVVIS